MKIPHLALASTLLTVCSFSYADITNCPTLIETQKTLWTKDVLVPNFNTASMDYDFNSEYFEAGLFSYRKAERACKEVTKTGKTSSP